MRDHNLRFGDCTRINIIIINNQYGLCTSTLHLSDVSGWLIVVTVGKTAKCYLQ